MKDTAALGLTIFLLKDDQVFASNKYKKVWPEIDNLTPVKDEALINVLEARLDVEFVSGNAQKSIVMFTPALRRGENVTAHSYVLGTLSKAPAYAPYLTVDAWLNHLLKKGKKATVAEAKQTRVHMFDEAKEEIGTSNAFECFGYELALKRRQYILSGGVWYEVATSFISKIDGLVTGIPKPKLSLPGWNGKEDEGAYNLRASKVVGGLHFDTKNIMFGGGQSKFEFCDLMHPLTKTLFFATIASKSSGMSHLVEQVRRTSELMFSADVQYRLKLAEVFTIHYPKQDAHWLDSRPKPGDFNLCFVSLGRPAVELPFFARSSLAKTYEDLREKGHDVSFISV